MTTRSVTHATFTIERVYKAPRERVFSAFSDLERKKQWFGGGAEVNQSMDFRVGGREHSEGEVEVHGSRHYSRFDAVYFDIIENERIIYAYDMDVNGDHVSASLTTIELFDTPAGTRLKLTEHGAYLDGYDDAGKREEGTKGLLEALAQSVET